VSNFVQQIINGLTLGSTYALIALGIAIVFSIVGLANFAHGELITICAYTMEHAYQKALELFLQEGKKK
jgi:branched-chain amino acid transport system permease protein